MAIFLPQPPRREGREVGPRELLEWAWQFFKAIAIDAHVLIEAEQFAEPAALDTANLPDPTDTTVAQAQLVANTALTRIRGGSFTAADLTIGTTITFGTPIADANYRVAIQRTSASGAIAAQSDEIASITKTAASFTVTTKAAPGAGTSVTFDYLVMR